MSRSDDAMKRLEANGLSFAAKPRYEIPQLPRDITDLHDDDLMDLFVTLTAWSDYLASQFAVAAIDEREAQRILDAAEARALIGGWKGGSGDRVTVAKANIAIDPKVTEYREDLDAKHAYRKLVETLTQNVDRDSALVSRELTRRTSDNSGFKSRARKYTV